MAISAVERARGKALGIADAKSACWLKKRKQVYFRSGYFLVRGYHNVSAWRYSQDRQSDLGCEGTVMFEKRHSGPMLKRSIKTCTLAYHLTCHDLPRQYHEGQPIHWDVIRSVSYVCQAAAMR